jgi:hypothetical protein
VSWRPLNRFYGVTQFYHGAVFPDGESYLGGAQDNGTLLGSDQRGLNRWIEIQGGDGGYAAIDPQNPATIYASTQNGRVWKSTTGGALFVGAVDGITDTGGGDDYRAVSDGFLFIAPLEMDPNDSSRLWLGGRRLWRTDNGAERWSSASVALEGGGKASAIAVAEGDSDNLLVGSDNGFIYRSDSATTATGESVWASVRPRRGFVSSLAFDPQDPRVAYATYAGFGGKHVWRTRDGGVTWEAIDGRGAAAVPNIPVHSLAIDPRDSAVLYLGTDIGVFVSTDSGASWAVENTGFATAVTEHLVVVEGDRREPDQLFAFTHGRGAWKVELLP